MLAIVGSCASFHAPRINIMPRGPAPAMVYTADLKTIKVGDSLPNVEVEVSTADKGVGSLKGVQSLLGEGRSILLGMPGAFTPTCSDLHLPGFYQKAAEFAELNVQSLNVITLNDRWVNNEWEKDQERCSASCSPSGERWTASPIQFLSDPRGDMLEDIGMIAYMGRDLGIRSKRFAMVVEDGVVKHVACDEGTELLDTTSAEAILKVVQKLESERVEQARKLAELRLAAELSVLGAVDALEYLQSEAVVASLRAAGVDDSVREAAIAVVEPVVAAERRRQAAEQAAAAELFSMTPARAVEYLSTQQQVLLDAGVPRAQIDEALAVVRSAAGSTAGQTQALSMGAGGGQNQAAVVGGVVAAAALVAAASFYLGGSPTELVPTDMVASATAAF